MSATKLAVAHEFDYSTGRMTVLSTFGADAVDAADDFAEKINAQYDFPSDVTYEPRHASVVVVDVSATPGDRIAPDGDRFVTVACPTCRYRRGL